MAGGDFRRSRRRERGAKDLVRRHFFLFFFFFFFFFACACTRPRRVKERYTLSKEKIYVVNARRRRPLARRGGERHHRAPRSMYALVFRMASEVLGSFCPLFFTLFPKKKTPAAPSSRNTFASVLVLSNVATYIHSSHYGKFKLSSRFSRGGSDSRREARDGGTRSRSRTVSRARGGSRFGRQICFRFFFSAF